MKRFLIIALAALISTSAFAASKKGTKAAPKPAANQAEAPKATPAVVAPKIDNGMGYGAAGCGLGAMVFGSQPGMIQVVAATLNGTFASQTFGITSGTSNCGGGGAAPTVKAFIEANRDALANDISRGNGETLNNLTQLMGCNNGKEVGATLQKNYKQIFPTTKASASQIETTIKTSLEGHCS